MTKRPASRSTSRTPPRNRARSTSTRRPTRSTPTRTNRRPPPRARINRTHVEWALGVLLLGIALVTLLSLLFGNRGRLTEQWVAALTQALGWGRYAVPVVMSVLSVWFLTRLSGQAMALPWKRLAGGLLLLVTLLGLVHHLSDQPESALAEGTGGGWLGLQISTFLDAALGWGGAVVIFILFLAIALILMLDLSLDDLIAETAALRKRIQAWRAARSPSTATIGSTSIKRPGQVRARPTGTSGSVTTSSAAGQARSAPSAPGAPQLPAARPAATSPSRVTTPPLIDADVPDVAVYEEHRWMLPPVEEMLAVDDEPPMSLRDIRDKTRIIEETLLSLGVPVTVVEVNPGPVVTQFGLEPGYVERQDRNGKVKRMKVQVAKIASLSNDIALALAASPIRIEAPVPGKGIVGIEVPNKDMAMVGLRSVMESDEFRQQGQHPLMVAFGRDVSGSPVVDDLASLPHLLIAGATGSGKSVCINALIACLLCRNTPDNLRLVMVDPKRVELSNYNGIPHLLTPVVVEPGRVVGVLKWLAAEMDRRYQLFSDAGARNLEAYNKKMVARGSPHLPYIVMFIDELADLMMVAPDEVERQVCRIAQLSRATGIHLVIATQRPSVDVVTGLIKANFPARLSFLVSSQIDSRVIIDSPGADKLLGSGDALYMAPDSPKLARIQGCFVSDGELERVIAFWKAQYVRAYEHSEADPIDPHKTVQKPLWPNMPNVNEDTLDNDEDDSLLAEATDLVVRHKKASVSFLQRELRIGYSRAARMIDRLEEQGVIGPPTGTSKAREVVAPSAGRGAPENESEGF
jgi:S-DNA-T family DNA segregation ATPase FtsK/SpoIIIE